MITFSVNLCRYKEGLVQELGLGDTQTGSIWGMTSPRSVQCEAASLSTEESEARPRYLQTPSPPPQPFLEVCTALLGTWEQYVLMMVPNHRAKL